ncbi:hypothetical protein U1Q18_010400, partial [Sarracenia purpurea var. burkii]
SDAPISPSRVNLLDCSRVQIPHTMNTLEDGVMVNILMSQTLSGVVAPSCCPVGLTFPFMSSLHIIDTDSLSSFRCYLGNNLLRVHDILSSTGTVSAAPPKTPSGHPALAGRGRGPRTRGSKATSSGKVISGTSSSRVYSSSTMHTTEALETVMDMEEETTSDEGTEETTSIERFLLRDLSDSNNGCARDGIEETPPPLIGTQK